MGDVGTLGDGQGMFVIDRIDMWNHPMDPHEKVRIKKGRTVDP